MTTTHAALTALTIGELRRRDPCLLPPGCRADDWLGRAVMDDAVKRRVLRHALRTGGPRPLLDVGMALPRFTFLPPIRVLLASTDTTVLAGKWMRLEGYYHSTHRTHIATEISGVWHCSHYAIAGPAPILAEHLLICGVLRGLLTAFGARGVRVAAGPTRSGRWTLTWRLTAAAPRPPLPWLPGEEPQARVARIIAADPARGWTLDEAARVLACSSRTLQRRLAAGDNRFATLLRATRVARAAELLLDSADSLADIGYACGFADQGHFQRSFKIVVGLTPAAYRRS